MSQHYADPRREANPTALPNVEVFHHEHAKRERCMLNAGDKATRYGECIVNEDDDCCGSGWYWQACFPGCLPDSDPIGPFDTEAAALADAQASAEDA